MTPAPVDHPAVPLARIAMDAWNDEDATFAFIRALTRNDTLYYSVTGGGIPQAYDFPVYEVRFRWYAGDEVFSVRLMVESQGYHHSDIARESLRWNVPCHLQAYEKPQAVDIRNAMAERGRQLAALRREILRLETENQRDAEILETL